jgi:hypothetical protein
MQRTLVSAHRDRQPNAETPGARRHRISEKYQKTSERRHPAFKTQTIRTGYPCT